ncbi:hypothetical protein GCM10027514_05210 [Azotobacter armeniacus]
MEIVQHQHLETGLEQGEGGVRADIAGAASYQDCFCHESASIPSKRIGLAPLSRAVGFPVGEYRLQGILVRIAVPHQIGRVDIVRANQLANPYPG